MPKDGNQALGGFNFETWLKSLDRGDLIELLSLLEARIARIRERTESEGMTIDGGRNDDVMSGGEQDDVMRGRRGDDDMSGGGGNDKMKGGRGDDDMDGGDGNDRMNGGHGNDAMDGGDGNDKMRGGRGDDDMDGGAGNDTMKGGNGDDTINGGDDDDMIESGLGNDEVNGGDGNDHILSISWGGEPVPAQDPCAQVEDDEPLDDDDVITGGEGADTFTFRWLIDAKDEILDKHRDENGNVDYQQVAGENGATHDHWVEDGGDKTITDFNPDEDELVFEGHTVNLVGTIHEDFDGDGTVDTRFVFRSIQNGGGAHDGDALGTVTILGHVVTLSNDDINRNVFYGVEDPYSADG